MKIDLRFRVNQVLFIIPVLLMFLIMFSGCEKDQLVNTTLGDVSPVSKGNSGKIVYYKEGEICLINPDGTGFVNLTNNSFDDHFAALSPDGRLIAFTTDRDGNYEIYLMNTDGTGLTNLTNSSSDENYTISWSPRGRQIAFSSNRDGNYEIYVMSSDGTGLTRLTYNSAEDLYPSWSPDGRKIAFVSYRDGNHEIYLMNPDGTGLINITNNASDDNYFPSWSPIAIRFILQVTVMGTMKYM